MEFELHAAFVIQLVSFFALLYLLNRLLFRPFGELLAERRERTDGDQETAARDSREAEEMAATIAAELAAAKTRVRAEVEELRRETGAREAEIFLSARVEAAARLGEVRAKIQRSREQAEAELAAQVGEMAERMAAAVIGPGQES
ncbi:MAG: ATP synthase F0 subunit B [Candidatus Binatia bacterium]